MKKKIDHPYWDIYSRLTSLRKAKPSAETRDVSRQLVLEAGLSAKDQMIINALMMLPWFNATMIEETFFLTLREKFSYSVLSPEMLDIIAAHSPLVEIGAGNGYYAWILQQMDVEVAAFDAYPVEEGKNWFFSTNRFGFPTRSGQSWTRVEAGDSKVVINYPDHTLLMCWPPINSMAVTCLSDYSGQKLIFIGDKKCCATSAFYKKLKQGWKLDYVTKTGSWSSCHTEWLEIYSRC